MLRKLFFSIIKNNDFIKIVSWTSIATIIRMIVTFGLSKLLAVYVGPIGISLLGQLSNIIGLFTTIASAGLNTATIKYIAEYQDKPEIKQKILNSVFTITIVISIITSFILLFFSSFLSKWLLQTTDYSNLFIVFGFSIILASLNNYLIAIVNGEKNYKLYTIISIINSLFMLIITSVFTYTMSLYGALLATILCQSFVAFLTLLIIFRYKSIYLKYIEFTKDIVFANKLFAFSLIALIPSVVVPLAQMSIRKYLNVFLSMEQGGLWEAMNRISTSYLMFFTSTVGVYYLPKLSGIQDKALLKKEIINTYKFIVPIFITFCFFLYVMKIPIIHLLFTEKFLSIQYLFGWQLLGDIMKIFSWVIAFLLIAKELVVSYLILEILFNIIYVLLIHYLVPIYCLQGAVIAYFVTYCVYFFAVTIVGVIFLNK